MTNDAEFNFDAAEGWRPTAGDILKGEVTATDVRHGDYEPYPIITVRQDDGVSLAFHAFHTVAKNQIAELDVQAGDRIGVLYRGKTQTRDGKGSYENYSIRKSNASARGTDWSKQLGIDSSDSGSDGFGPVDASAPPIAPSQPTAPAAPAGSQFGSDVPF